jgi:integrase
MKRTATRSYRRHRYTKVLDARKHGIRGLWRRNGKYVARITVENDAGRKAMKWVSLAASTAAEAQEEFRTLLVERKENRLRHIGRCPKFGDYVEQTYEPRLPTSGKKPDTLVTERVHLKQWRASIGHLYLDKIRPNHVNAHLQKLKENHKANRTCNLAFVVLRNVLKAAKVDGYITVLPVDGIDWMSTEKKARPLYTPEDIRNLCAAAFKTRMNDKAETVPVTKNAQQFVDYIRLLALTGAREQETLKVRWNDVRFEVSTRCLDCKHTFAATAVRCPKCGSERLKPTGFITIGADADTKNHEARHVDFNSELEAHLKDMYSRRAPESQWLFPSPQRGANDDRTKTFRESLLLARKAAGMDKFGFHDCRHHFISYAVMAGIDFMTIARWVGHKDGGVLIGKVYGHLSNEHAQAQAQKLVFSPTIVEVSAASRV